MDRRIRALLAVLIAGLLVGLVALNVGAAGLGVGPPNMEIADAERGQQYQKLIFVNYNNETDCIIELSVSGEISNWVTFYAFDDSLLTTPVERTAAANKEWTYVRVKFDIPSDAPIGDATGTIHVLTVPPEGDEEGGTTLSLTGKVNVTIDVAGEGEEDGETPASTPTPALPLDMTPTPALTTPSTPEEEAPLNVWIIVGPILGVLGAGGAGYYLATKRG